MRGSKGVRWGPQDQRAWDLNSGQEQREVVFWSVLYGCCLQDTGTWGLRPEPSLPYSSIVLSAKFENPGAPGSRADLETIKIWTRDRGFRTSFRVPKQRGCHGIETRLWLTRLAVLSPPCSQLWPQHSCGLDWPSECPYRSWGHYTQVPSGHRVDGSQPQ